MVELNGRGHRYERFFVRKWGEFFLNFSPRKLLGENLVNLLIDSFLNFIVQFFKDFQKI